MVFVAAAEDVNSGANGYHCDADSGERYISGGVWNGPSEGGKVEDVDFVVDRLSGDELSSEGVGFVSDDGDGVRASRPRA